MYQQNLIIPITNYSTFDNKFEFSGDLRDHPNFGLFTVCFCKKKFNQKIVTQT